MSRFASLAFFLYCLPLSVSAASPTASIVAQFEATCLSYMGKLSALNDVLSSNKEYRQGKGAAADTLLHPGKGVVWINVNPKLKRHERMPVIISNAGLCSMSQYGNNGDELAQMLTNKFSAKPYTKFAKHSKKSQFYELKMPVNSESPNVLVRINNLGERLELFAVSKSAYEQDRAKNPWYNSKFYWFAYEK